MSDATCARRAEVVETLRAARDLDTGLEVHVRDCAACAGFIREHAAGGDDLFEELQNVLPGRAAAQSAPPDIDGYEIEREIHRGGQGIVYAARQLGTQRTVALKLLRGDSFATPTQRQRFEREIEIVASFDHPHIVTVYESGCTATGSPYLAQEYVEGAPLHRYLAEARPGQREVLSLFCRICEGMNFAHQRGVLHRDLKPANVLVDHEGRPRIVDFGLAKDVARDPDVGSLTADGIFVGTLAYASPEQVSSGLADVDLRTDVYSLGVMLYEALTGRLPYPPEGGIKEVAHAIVHTEPAPVTGIDAELELVVRTALAKDPGRRYQTAGALGTDLAHYLRGEPLDAHPDTALYRLRKTVRRYQRRVAAAAVMLVLALGATVAVTIQWQDAEKARGETARALDFVRVTLFSPFHGGSPERDHRLLDALLWGSPQVQTRFAADPHTELRLHEDFAKIFRQFEEPDPAVIHARRSHELAVQLYGADSAKAGDTAHRLARLLHTRALSRHLGVPWRKNIGRGSDAPAGALSGLSPENLAELEEALALAEGALPIRSAQNEDSATSTARSVAAMRQALGRPASASESR